ncbi:MAG: hypothetical protein LBC86_03070 [Oscillospiraceae bacterium]|jgi:hypothetical protein|nr:hypothetical protein [Oscillospiraceae bacterium]
MEMIQTYQGYFREDGRFISDSLLIQIPVGRRAIVNVLDDEVVATTVTSKEKNLKQLFAEAEKAENALTSDEWAEFENLRSQTNLERAVDL